MTEKYIIIKLCDIPLFQNTYRYKNVTTKTSLNTFLITNVSFDLNLDFRPVSSLQILLEASLGQINTLCIQK